MKALDLNFDLGGCAIGLKKAGINVVYAVGDSKLSNQIYLHNFKDGTYSSKDLLEISINDLPEIDFVTGKLNFGYSSLQYKMLNEKIIEIIMNKKPKFFLMRVLDTSFRAYLEEVEKFAKSCRGYECDIQTFEEKNYINCPIAKVQKYLIGIREDVGNGKVKLRKNISPKEKNEFQLDDAENISEWYRSVYREIELQYEKDKLYLHSIHGTHGTVVTSEIVYTMNKETYLVDSIGVRRFTHNELARAKGLFGIDFNRCKKKRNTYIQIQNSCNAYIIQKIAENLKCYASMQDDIGLHSKNNKRKLKDSQKVLFPKLRIDKMYIKKLKGIEELEIQFSDKLTAIMGVNGIGKSTILHALACIYSPYQKGDDYQFPFFFTPNPDMSWKNSKFCIDYYDYYNGKNIKREYKKDKDRWAPRYVNRPKRDVYYIGIDSCIPEIEKEKQTSFIDYLTSQINDNLSDKILKATSYVLNKQYDQLTINKTKKKELLGVKTNEGISYTSLSMGAGEQRVFRIMQILYNAYPYSLILIDEIELLLHVTALHRLVKKIYEIASNNNLQIIFTTHSMEMSKLDNFVEIRYLRQTSLNTMVYNSMTSDLIYELTSERKNELKLYVEDLLAEVIIKRIAFEMGMSRNVKVIKFGAARNAFVLAVGFVIEPNQNNNKLIILDGDVYRENDEKKKEIKKLLTGTEKTHDNRVQEACEMITQFTLEKGQSPEKNIYDMLTEMGSNNECTNIAQNIHAVNNSHEWLSKIADEMGYGIEATYTRIIDIVSENTRWETYVKNVRDWLLSKKENMSPSI